MTRLQIISLYGVVVFNLCAQAWTKDCPLQGICSDLGYSSQTAIAHSDLSLKTYLSCPRQPSTITVTQIKWLFSPNTGIPQVLDTNTDPKLTTKGYTLVISNISSEYEGIYSCKFQYSDGSESTQMGAGCVFSTGRSHFTSCPGEQTSEGCSDTTHLEGEEDGSVEFDARLDYSHGGSCGLRQVVRNMYLNWFDDNGNSKSLFICRNLGSFGSRNCENSTHVTISYQGEDKYDLKLSLTSLNTSNSGRYQLVVNRNEMERRRSTIHKEFSVTVRAKSTRKSTSSPPTTRQPDSTKLHNATKYLEDVRPLLVLDGEIVHNITFESIKVKGQALLCVMPHRYCCNTRRSTAEFLYPNGTVITADEGCAHGLYVTKGRRIVRLNYASGMANALPPAGSYCCSVSIGNVETKLVCANLEH